MAAGNRGGGAGERIASSSLSLAPPPYQQAHPLHQHHYHQQAHYHQHYPSPPQHHAAAAAGGGLNHHASSSSSSAAAAPAGGQQQQQQRQQQMVPAAALYQYHHHQGIHQHQHQQSNKRQKMISFAAGDRVDAMDLEGVWHEGLVKEVDPGQGYRVHFLGWSARWDEWVEVASERIQPAYSKVRNWRPALRVGDPVEVRSAVYQDRWLSGIVVAVCPEEKTVKCEYSHDSRWVETFGEEICLPNTHFSRELDNMSPQKIEQIYREAKIHTDCRAGKVDGVTKLIKADPTLVHLRGPLERSPLLIASDSCHLNVVKVLLGAGADITDIDRSNANCLHLAVRGQKDRCPAVVKELAEKGADVSARDSRLSTPLHLVAMRGYHDVGLTLIEHGADLNAKDMSEVTCLRHAAYRGEEQIVRLLLRFGADPTITDAAGGKPVDVACYLRNGSKRPVVEQLLRDGHIGYMLKKNRQILMWEAGCDEKDGGRAGADAVLASRREMALEPSRVEFHPEKREMALEPPRAEFHPEVPLESACPDRLQEACEVAFHALTELNRDMFSELCEYFV